jgi:hypothetical protein
VIYSIANTLQPVVASTAHRTVRGVRPRSMSESTESVCCWQTAEYASIDDMSPVELLVRRISEIQDLLSTLPNDAFAERSALLAEREELGRRAERYAAGADRERPAEDLRHELALLRDERNGLAFDDPRSVRISARIDRLAGILADMGADVS